MCSQCLERLGGVWGRKKVMYRLGFEGGCNSSFSFPSRLIAIRCKANISIMYSTIQKKYNHRVELQQIMQNAIISMRHMCPKTIRSASQSHPKNKKLRTQAYPSQKQSAQTPSQHLKPRRALVYLDYETPQVIYALGEDHYLSSPKEPCLVETYWMNACSLRGSCVWQQTTQVLVPKR